MKKLLYINQHLSTGGSCEYTRKQIEVFKDSYNISLIEVHYYGSLYTVQRDKIENLVDFYPLYGRQDRLWPTIKRINPDYISFQEVPNSFVDADILEKIFDSSRDWKITATAHSNKTRKSDFTFIPDRLIAVNEWQKKLFQQEFKGLCDVSMWEYPIEKKDINPILKAEARKRIGWDDGFHILNVGLFTRGKNQGEIFEIAKQIPGAWFHFVGNQADNFKDYWQPLMENRPSNCMVWGEKANVEDYYAAADMFLFTSIYELWPICLREALSYNLLTLMKKLPSYLNEYDNTPLVEYIDSNTQKTIATIDEYISRNRK